MFSRETDSGYLLMDGSLLYTDTHHTFICRRSRRVLLSIVANAWRGGTLPNGFVWRGPFEHPIDKPVIINGDSSYHCASVYVISIWR